MKNLANKIWNLFNDWLPFVWGFTLAAIITGGFVGVFIIVVKWLLQLVGVL